MKKHILFTAILLLAITLSLSAQEFGFGFGDDAGSGLSAANPLSVNISGEASASLMAYTNDFSDGIKDMTLGDVFFGRLNFSAETSIANAFIGLKLYPTESPVKLDEAYVRAYLGDFEIVGGLRKLTWGKADSFGPLDVINPKDYSELNDLSNMMNIKIARPMVHLSYRIGSFSKIEGVFVPTFEPIRFAEEGRWLPPQMAELYQLETFGTVINKPDTSTLKFAQAGLRFTTTIGSADIGAQYYFGRLHKPAVTMTFAPPSPIPSSIDFAYNPFHQIGFDWAQVLFGFNIRAEIAANITHDIKGDDGSVYNPHLAWSFGFDRNLFWDINLNLQANETIRLMNNNVSSNPLLDIEAGADITYTQIIAALSRSFFKDRVDARVALFWEVEANSFLVMPSLKWKKDGLAIELMGGFFGGEEAGQFGQFKDNSFLRTALTYSF